MYRVIETHLIETFVEVVRRGSVTEAARALHRSQPAISHRLKQLEEAFGTPLFEKVGRELQLTDAGERLVDDAVDILARLQALPGRVAEPEAVRGTVSVGGLPSMGPYLLSSAMKTLLAAHADLKLVVRYGLPDELRSELMAGRLDVAVMAGELDSTGLRMSTVGEVRPRLVLAEELAPSGEMTIDHLRGLRYLAHRGQQEPIATAIDEWVLASDLVGPVTPEVPDWETLRALAGAGLGFLVVPDYVSREDEAAGRLVGYGPPGLERTFALRIVTRSRAVEGTAAARVRAILAEQFAPSS